MTTRDEIQKLSPNDSQYRIAARIADRVLEGDIPDPTARATHFLNEKIVRQRLADRYRLGHKEKGW